MIAYDETTLQVLKEVGRSPQSKSYMWAQMTDASGSSGTGPPIRLFSYLKALLVALPLAQTADDYEALLPWNLVLPAD